MCRIGNRTFLDWGGRIESECRNLIRIGEIKIFHELDVQHV